MARQYGRADQGMFHDVIDFLAENIHTAGTEIPQGLDILIGGHHGNALLSDG